MGKTPRNHFFLRNLTSIFEDAWILLEVDEKEYFSDQEAEGILCSLLKIYTDAMCLILDTSEQKDWNMMNLTVSRIFFCWRCRVSSLIITFLIQFHLNVIENISRMSRESSISDTIHLDYALYKYVAFYPNFPYYSPSRIQSSARYTEVVCSD